MKYYILFFLLISTVLQNCQQNKTKRTLTIGVKIYETQASYRQLFREWNDMGINSAFVSVELAYDEAFRELARENDVMVFVIPSIAAWILQNYQESWTNWKYHNIVSIVKDIAIATKTVYPELLINFHAVPWRENDFEGAIKKIAGQDFKQLAGIIDIISPMCYSHMLKRDARWVSSVIKNIHEQAGKTSLLPSIQVKEAYLEEVLSEEEFEENLEAALKPPSTGVVFWSWAHLEQDPGKKSIISKWVKK